MTEEAQAVTEAPAEPTAPEAAPERDPNRVYTQAEMDAIAAKIKKNERYRTRKEIEAYYQGRESVAAPRKEPEAQPAPKVDAAPTRDQFDSYEAFLEAKTEYTARKSYREEREKVEQETAKQKAQRERTERVEKFRKATAEKYPDINDRVAAVEHIGIPEHLGDAIAESEFGPDVLNHLVSNPKDFERIAALPQSQALREIGRIEARLEAAQSTGQQAASEAPKAEPKKISSVPAPINPVAGKAVTGDGEPSHDNPEAWRRWRDRQVQKKKATG